MKRFLIVCVLAWLGIVTLPASAMPTISSTPQISQTISVPSNGTAYQNGYNTGYKRGKDHAYNNVAKTVAFVGVAVVAGVIIYHLANPRWTTNENGVVYRF